MTLNVSAAWTTAATGVGQSYDYPDDYLAPAGSGALSADGRADLRLASLMRTVGGEDHLPEGSRASRTSSRKAAS